MQEFFINKNSINPVLRMELISDGKYEYKKNVIFNHSIQNADVTFSMKNVANNILKISKSKAEIIQITDCDCSPQFIIQYKWKKRDVNEEGVYKAWFEITFYEDLYEEGVEHPSGNLIVPIEEELIINVL